ncbi:MAG TPA: hypothetical protein VHX16_14105 [Chloroflexota bacterium]|jgi:CcmD family protein|nr:hypothetical protein [Chloroflexota bacterium]
MEQWTFALAAFVITFVSIGGYVLVLRARLKGAEAALRDDGRAGIGSSAR